MPLWLSPPCLRCWNLLTVGFPRPYGLAASQSVDSQDRGAAPVMQIHALLLSFFFP